MRILAEPILLVFRGLAEVLLTGRFRYRIRDDIISDEILPVKVLIFIVDPPVVPKVFIILARFFIFARIF